MPMFNHGNLTLARKRRQMTKKHLAQLAGITALTLTRIENGVTSEPSSDTLIALAKGVRYPVDFFFGPSHEALTSDTASFRSLSGMSAAQRDAALAAGQIALTLARWIDARFTLPKPDLPDLRDEEPDVAAQAARSYWGIGYSPIPDLVKLLEAKGVRVFTLAEQNKNVDAFSFWKDEIPYVFLNTFKSAERTRFDAAHELGHLLLHRHTTSGRENGEREADRFAAAFLMPKEDIIGRLPRIHSLAQLMEAKHRWGVSLSALARTAHDNGLLSDWHYRELCKQMSLASYRRTEPQGRAPEKSVVWQKILRLLWQQGCTRAHIASDLHLPEDEIEALIGPLVNAPAVVVPAMRRAIALA